MVAPPLTCRRCGYPYMYSGHALDCTYTLHYNLPLHYAWRGQWWGAQQLKEDCLGENLDGTPS